MMPAPNSTPANGDPLIRLPPTNENTANTNEMSVRMAPSSRTAVSTLVMTVVTPLRSMLGAAWAVTEKGSQAPR